MGVIWPMSIELSLGASVPRVRLPLSLRFNLFPSKEIYLIIILLIFFEAALIFASPKLSFETSVIYSFTDLMFLVPVFMWFLGLNLINSTKLSQRFFQSVVLLLVFAPMLTVLGVFLYIMFSLTASVPYADNLLESWDRALGFDWITYARFLAQHPLFTSATFWCYQLMHPALLLVGIEAIIVGETHRCKSLIMLTICSSIFTIILASFFPSLGTMSHLGGAEIAALFPPGTGVEHIESLISLRQSETFLIDPSRMIGIAEFPSFHTVAAVLIIYAARGNIIRSIIFSIFSFLMIAATPIYGCHYFVDILAGIVVAMFFITMERLYYPAVPKT